MLPTLPQWLPVLLLTSIASTTDAFLPSTGRHGVSLIPNKARQQPADDRSSIATTTTKTKTTQEISFIQESLGNNVLFENIAKAGLDSLVEGLEKFQVSEGDVIVQQGDASENDYVYLVAEGTCSVEVDGTLVPEPYDTLKPTDIFGELGVLYGDKRGATIAASTDTATLFRIDGRAFKDILLNRILDSENMDLETMQQVDWAINKVEGTIMNYGGNIIPTYQPERAWLWQQFEGTVLPISIPTTVANVGFCVLFCLYARIQIYGGDVNIMDMDWAVVFTEQLVPDKSLPFVEKLDLVHDIWHYFNSPTTFVLTFFLSQAYGFWNKAYEIGRDLQGRIDDFNLLLATSAERNPDGTLTKEAQQVLDDVGQYSRLFHALVWASLTKRFSVLATPYGLERMQSRGVISAEQCDILQNVDVPKNSLYHVPLEWMIIKVTNAMASGTVAGDTATKGQFLTQTRMLRNDPSNLQSKLAGRMPLPYVHLVQILVDCFVILSPLALYAELGDYCVFAVALLTFFYSGLLNLAKVFLDPLNNEKFYNSIYMDLGVLIRESNAASVGWKNAGAKLPFSSRN